MPENIKITLQPAPVQQIQLKTGPTTILQGTIGSGANAFGVVNVTGQNNIIATSNSDTLRVVAGSGILLTNDPPNNALTIIATGGSSFDQFARDTANSGWAKANTANVTGEAAYAKANTANVTGQAAFDKANTAIYTAAQIRANVSNTAPVNYDPSTGIFSHALSGATATGYGDAATVAKVVVDDKGHVTSVTNTAIALSAASITSGTLAVNRGGTGQNTYANGELLIGNTISGGLDRSNLTQGYGIIVTNRAGSITIDAATGRTYYLVLSQASDIPTYNVAQIDPSANAEVNTSIVYTGTSYQLTSVFATPPGDPNTYLLPAGTYGRHLHATTDGVNNEAQIRVDLYKRASNTLETLLRSNESPTFNSGNAASVLLNWNITDSNSYALDVTDRLIWKLYVRRVSGGSGSVQVTLYYEGTDRASYIPSTILTTADVVARAAAAAAYVRANTANVTAEAAFAKANTANITAEAAFSKANTANVTGQAAFDKANTAIYTAAQIRANISNTAPINYDSTTGIISHAASGVTATGYGDAATLPKVVVDANGHVTSVTNTAIAISASAITSGTLVVARGGTGLSPTISNGAILIGNTVNNGFDLNTIANTGSGGILVTNDKGSITLGANVIWMRGNIGAVAPITYTAANGTFTHDGSGVTATGYGSASQVPVFTVNERGHVTSVTNTSIAIDAGAITTGTLAVNRGGTGQSSYANGELLIGNTTSGGLDKRTLTQGTGIVITNGNGTIRIDASGGAATDEYARTKANGAVQLGYPQINVAANATLIAATTNNDTLVLIAGSNITLTPNAANHSIAISSTGGGGLSGVVNVASGGTGLTPTVVNGALLIGNTVNSGFDLNTLANTGSGGILITNGQGTITLGANVIWVRGNVGAVSPISYTASNGNFTHAGSGVTATGYGTPSQIPVFVVNETGHLTSVTNTAIAGLDAGVITTGSLTVPRGGTGLSPTIVNGAILIGNTVNSGFDLNTIANTGSGGILITNGQGTITLGANVIWMRGNLAAVTPLTYTASNGTFTHAGSGITATGYGTASQIPVFVVNETGHLTSVTNTAIAGLDAGVITTGRLEVPRGGTGLTPTIVNGAILIGNTVNSGFDLNTIANTGTGGILIDNGKGTITLAANVIWMRGNISATTPISYAPSTGVVSHATSGVVATGYGTAALIPVFVVNDTGHVTSVTNTAIAGLDAGVITSGSLTVPRGGTGLNPTIANGAILIGNTVNSGFDLNTIANTGTGGILVENGKGTITLAANVIWMRGNISATAPISYAPSTGVITHSTSGVTATGYGSGTEVAKVVVDDKGHVTSASNVAIAGLDAGVITTGTLVVGRGGTGQSSYANGELLIGNTTSGGLDKKTLTQGSGILITNGNGTIEIAATGGAAQDQYARDKANGAVQLGYPKINVAANATLIAATTNNDTLFLLSGEGITFASNAAQSSITITSPLSAAAPLTYTVATTTLTHDTSGVTATGYGTASQVPVFEVTDKGHITTVTNTAIAIAASAITSGTLAVARGGTGLSPTIANGALLIGNTVNGGFDLATLTQGTNITITNGQGTITIDATAGGGGNGFGVVVVSGQSNLNSDAANDTLTVVAGDNMVITTDAATDTLTLNAYDAFARSTANAASTVGTHTLWIPAWSMYPTATNGASPANGLYELVTNDIMLKTLDFDTTTAEKAQFTLCFGNSWDLGTVTAKAVWSHNVTTVNFGVSWSVAGHAYSDNEAGDAALGSAVVISDTGGTANNIYISPATAPITIGGTPADGDWIVMEVSRSVANASDTLAIDARLHGIQLTYTTDASTDA